MRILFLNFEFGMQVTRGFWQMPLYWRYFNYPRVVRQVSCFMKEQGIALAGFVEINFPHQAGLFETVTQMSAAGRTIYKSRFAPFIRQGNLLLSRYPINNYSIRALPGKGQPRAVVRAEIKTPHGAITVLLTHLSLGKEARHAQIEALNSICLGTENPFILMGDFNSADWRGELKPLFENDKLQHADSGPTYPSWNPTKHLDHIFLSSDFRIKEVEVYQKEKFSDHAALIAEVD